jgi:hypothetical protein
MNRRNIPLRKPRLILVVTTLFVALFLTSIAQSQCIGAFGDINGNGEANVVDVQCVILTTFYAMGGSQDLTLIDCLAGPIEDADTNCDGTVNVVDATMTISAAMTVPLSLMADYNGNDCPNSCDINPKEAGSLEPFWELSDYQPDSAHFGETYGLANFEGVTVVSLLSAS